MTELSESAERARNIAMSLDEALGALRLVGIHLNNAHREAREDYQGNATGIVSLIGATDILRFSLVSDLVAWEGFAQARKNSSDRANEEVKE